MVECILRNREWGKVGENGEISIPLGSHDPVLVDEILFWLRCKPGGVYVDCTIGYAGLAMRILDQNAPAGALIGIDRDDEALEAAHRRL